MGLYRSEAKDLEKYGPRLEIELGPPIVRTPSGVITPRHRTHSGEMRYSRMPALIDTGASRTVITPEAVARVGLAMVDQIQVSRPGGSDLRGVYVASVQFPRQKLSTIEAMEVICCELPDQPIQCLLGRDVLSRWIFTYDGPLKAWEISEKDVAIWINPTDDFGY
jgi:predicted aspartyl protease